MAYSFMEWQKMTGEQRKQAGFSQAPTFMKFIYIGLPLGFLLIIIVSIFGGSEEPKKEVALTPQQQHQALVESQFSKWDGSHITLTAYIKKNMNDPGSFEHVETTYYELDSLTLYVLEKFRGKNAFGGLVLNEIKANIDLNGNILKID